MAARLAALLLVVAFISGYLWLTAGALAVAGVAWWLRWERRRHRAELAVLCAGQRAAERFDR